jgi:hypothetical protein
LTAVLRILKGILAGLGWGYLAGALFALLLIAEFAMMVGKPGLNEAAWAFLSMMGLGSPLIVSVGITLGVLIPELIRAQRNAGTALLVGFVVAALSGFAYSELFKVPFSSMALRALQFGGYVLLWAIWYAFHTRKRLMKANGDVPRG